LARKALIWRAVVLPKRRFERGFGEISRQHGKNRELARRVEDEGGDVVGNGAVT